MSGNGKQPGIGICFIMCKYSAFEHSHRQRAILYAKKRGTMIAIHSSWSPWLFGTMF
jgi:hypothetical protein